MTYQMTVSLQINKISSNEYINIINKILDIIHLTAFYLKLNSTLLVSPYLTGNTLRLRYETNRLMLSIVL
jgi:hypothetical protein